MNKSKKLTIMKLRAKIKAGKKMDRHKQRWFGEEVREVGKPKPFELSPDGQPIITGGE